MVGHFQCLSLHSADVVEGACVGGIVVCGAVVCGKVVGGAVVGGTVVGDAVVGGTVVGGFVVVHCPPGTHVHLPSFINWRQMRCDLPMHSARPWHVPVSQGSVGGLVGGLVGGAVGFVGGLVGGAVGFVGDVVVVGGPVGGVEPVPTYRKLLGDPCGEPTMFFVALDMRRCATASGTKFGSFCNTSAAAPAT